MSFFAAKGFVLKGHITFKRKYPNIDLSVRRQPFPKTDFFGEKKVI